MCPALEPALRRSQGPGLLFAEDLNWGGGPGSEHMRPGLQLQVLHRLHSSPGRSDKNSKGCIESDLLHFWEVFTASHQAEIVGY